MSKRTLIRDPDNARKAQYRTFDNNALSALWEVVELLSNDGIDIGPKATEILAERQAVKERCPKSTNTSS